MKLMQYDVLIYRDSDSGLYLAEVPDLSGCMSQGDTVEEAKVNIQEAIQSRLAAMHVLGQSIPEPSEHVLATVKINVA